MDENIHDKGASNQNPDSPQPMSRTERIAERFNKLLAEKHKNNSTNDSSEPDLGREPISKTYGRVAKSQEEVTPAVRKEEDPAQQRRMETIRQLHEEAQRSNRGQVRERGFDRER